MRRRHIPFWISAFIHLAVISGVAALWVEPPQYAVDAGRNSVEVSLIAAAPDPTPAPLPLPQPQETVDPQPPQPDDIIVPVVPPVSPLPVPPPEQPVVNTPAPPVPEPPKPHHIPTIAKGDGSSPKPGKDAVTFSSAGGAQTEARPDYLRNPPPVYPEPSRLAKQEGTVVLEVIVDSQGLPDGVSVQTSSGFSLLDQSAVNAVQTWRFRPASLGGMKIKSHVLVPVLFQLHN
jgi:protein TonB